MAKPRTAGATPAPRGPAPAPKTPIGILGQALTLVFQAIAVAEIGLEKNPSKEQQRELEDTAHDLELQRAAIEAKMDALIDKIPGVTGPTPDQVAKISQLTTQVGALTRDSTTASGAVALTSRVLALATQVAAGAPPPIG